MRGEGPARGLFVSLEGVEGAGKTTQARMLVDHLERVGIRSVLLREPGGTPMAEAVRAVLLDSRFSICPEAETLLFLAARAQNTAERIRPALESGITVVCDRYSDSTVAYQGYGRGADVEIIRGLLCYATGGLWPDVTILLDLDPSQGLARQTVRNRMEDEPLQFHRRVREGYLAEAEAAPERMRVLDAAASPEILHGTIVGIVMGELARSGHGRHAVGAGGP